MTADPASLPRRRALEVIPELVTLAEARVVDVGCGDGALVRALTRLGAHVVGVECGAAPLAKARAAEPAGDERYLQGVGEALPLESGAHDLVVFLNSLHHVPVPHMAQALAEACRVLVPGGHVLVNEPWAEGNYFELTRLIEDEFEVRRAAQAAVLGAGALGLEAVAEVNYLNPIKHDDYEAFAARMGLIDPDRADRVAAHEATLRQVFRRQAEERDGAFWFTQPARINLLRKPDR